MSGFDPVDVVLAEDNAYEAELVMRAIRTCEFVSGVHWVRDGTELLDFLRCTGPYAGRDRRQRPKLVLLDLKMPKVNGLDVLRMLRSSAEASIPIVMITSSGEERDVAESYDLGVNSFVVKPVESRELSEAMRTICVYWLRLNRVPAN